MWLVLKVRIRKNVEIYGNKSYNNTGGILVFDLPGLTRNGRNVKVYDNEVYENNLFNFSPKGNIVASVPSRYWYDHHGYS